MSSKRERAALIRLLFLCSSCLEQGPQLSVGFDLCERGEATGAPEGLATDKDLGQRGRSVFAHLGKRNPRLRAAAAERKPLEAVMVEARTDVQDSGSGS